MTLLRHRGGPETHRVDTGHPQVSAPAGNLSCCWDLIRTVLLFGCFKGWRKSRRGGPELELRRERGRGRPAQGREMKPERNRSEVCATALEREVVAAGLWD